MVTARRFVALSCLSALAGCPLHFGSVQPAETLGQGNLQVGIEPGVVAAGGVFAPAVDIAFRYGVSDRFDIGGRVGLTTIYDVNFKYQFTDPMSDGVIVSIAPTFTFFALGGSGGSVAWGNLGVPVLVGIPVGAHELTIGPRVNLWYVGGGGGGTGASGALLFAGMSIGFAARVADGFRIMPDLTLWTPVAAGASAGGDSVFDTIGQAPLGIDFRLGLLIGTAR